MASWLKLLMAWVVTPKAFANLAKSFLFHALALLDLGNRLLADAHLNSEMILFNAPDLPDPADLSADMNCFCHNV